MGQKRRLDGAFGMSAIALILTKDRDVIAASVAPCRRAVAGRLLVAFSLTLVPI